MAPKSIVNGIRALELQEVDTIIVGRGGGSIEDLWAFNEEVVAQAIFDCKIPIISAVGHETDTTIADFVADLRAATPSAAAELAVCDIQLVFDRIEGTKNLLNRQVKRKLERSRAKFTQLKLQLQYKSPMNQIKEKRTYAMKLEEQLQDIEKKILRNKRHRLELYIEKIKGLSPLDKLNQGFSYTSTLSGKTINSIHNVKPEDYLKIHVKDGEILAEVKETKGYLR
jgi:exodeoxyribonuclease VII large subunit